MFTKLPRLLCCAGALCAAATLSALAQPPTPVADAPPGIDVQARGPVHEAYAEAMAWVNAQAQFTAGAKAEFADADNADLVH